MELGAAKLALEEINKKLAIGTVDSELNLLAKGLGVSKETLIVTLTQAVSKELSEINAQITFNSAMSH